MATLLITAFGPFPGAPDNPSARLVARIARMRRPALSSDTMATHVFATSYAAIDREMPRLLAQHRPRVMVMFGVAGRTNFMRIERQARNLVSLVFPDAQHFVPRAATIRRQAPSVLHGHAPFERLLAAARTTGMACRPSTDAGRYVCNYAYWRGLEAAARRGGPDIVVFVHVPKLYDRTRRSLTTRRPSLDQLARAAQAVLISALSGARRR